MSSRSLASTRSRSILLLALLGALVAACPSSEPKASRDAGTPPADGGNPPSEEPLTIHCAAPRATDHNPLRRASTRHVPKESFDRVLATATELCSACHVNGAEGNFQFQPTYEGLKAKGQIMSLRARKGDMPPLADSATQKRAVQMGLAMQAWFAQGAPNGEFDAELPDSSSGKVTVDEEVGAALTDLGSCIPDRLGTDAEKDGQFAAMGSFDDLPVLLTDADREVATFDAKKMARFGTVAFAPTYQLFSDNAKKLRLIHVPAGTSVRYDPATKQFAIPPNTRFYKTFLKPVKEADGQVRYRRVETRLIVTREKWQDALFATYVWNADETQAELHTVPYRDGTPFSDRVLVHDTDETTCVTDETTGKKTCPSRNYALPGRDRCVQCHGGSEAGDFVLGFSPLEVNRRPAGEGGVRADVPILEDELGQADHLLRLGVISGVSSAAELPKLEEMGPTVKDAQGNDHKRKPRNEHELALQGYMVGNCASCHNPKGFAVQSNPAAAHFDLSAGRLFEFDPATKESDGVHTYLLTAVSDFKGSLAATEGMYHRIFGRVHFPTNATNLHMPQNVPGQDCRASLLVARWIATFDIRETAPGSPADPTTEEARRARIQEAEQWVAESCTDPADVRWVTEDNTEKVPYEPRNTEWREHMTRPEFSHLTGYTISPELVQLARMEFAAGFWLPKKECTFAPGQPPAVEENWMYNAQTGRPKQPWGELYYTTPGAAAFSSICASCHGRKGDAQTGAAKALRSFNGARVANFPVGMFGTSTSGEPNTKLFDATYGDHGGARYLTFMGVGGTKVTFPKEFIRNWMQLPRHGLMEFDFANEQQMERWGANMLAAARDTCSRVRKGSYADVFTLFEPSERMWTRVCTQDNPVTPEIRNGSASDPAVEAWERRAQFNVGVTIYIYLADRLARGDVKLLPDECEKRAPAP